MSRIPTNIPSIPRGMVTHMTPPLGTRCLPISTDAVSALCVAEYIGPAPDCDTYKKIAKFVADCPPTFCWFRNGEPIPEPTETEKMALTLYAAEATPPRCEVYTFEPLDLTSENAPAGTTLADLLPLIVAGDGGPQAYPNFGAIDVATDIVMSLRSVGETTADVILVDGNPQGGLDYTLDPDKPGTFPGQTPIEVPEGCEQTLTLCIARFQNKAGEATDAAGTVL